MTYKFTPDEKLLEACAAMKRRMPKEQWEIMLARAEAHVQDVLHGPGTALRESCGGFADVVKRLRR